MSDSGTQKRCCCKVDCSDNVAAAREQQKPEKNPPKGPAVVLSYPSWWSWLHKTSCEAFERGGGDKTLTNILVRNKSRKKKACNFPPNAIWGTQCGLLSNYNWDPYWGMQKDCGGWGAGCLVARGERKVKVEPGEGQKFGKNVSPSGGSWECPLLKTP